MSEREGQTGSVSGEVRLNPEQEGRPTIKTRSPRAPLDANGVRKRVRREKPHGSFYVGPKVFEALMLRSCDEILMQQADCTAALIWRLRIMLQRHHIEAALQALRAVLRLLPGDPTAERLHARLLDTAWDPSLF